MPTVFDAAHSGRNTQAAVPFPILRDFLSHLERCEASLLTWGIVDGGFSREEVEIAASEFLQGRDVATELTPDSLLDAMLDARVLFDLPVGNSRIYRTRMAETVRLLAHLRQIFKFEQWRTAPTLVSDFRFALRPREYPRRDIPAPQALEHWNTAGVLTPSRRTALAVLLDRPGLHGLAGFQLRATERAFRDLDGAWTRGMIVTVGTGTGKTLAFYLPALADVASHVARDEHWTKVLAIYPRNELLKDQFSDTYAEARRLDALLIGAGKRKVTIGAFFGQTPNTASEGALEDKHWKRAGTGYICPYLRCPAADCEGDLVWRREDVAAGRESLRCGTCGTVLPEDTLLLTRARMAKTPPDVLFTTTEMLNRSMGDSYNRHIFGIGVSRSPRMVLLDEAHTYSGVHGAQVGLLLRRWRHAVRAPVQFTGLSATLSNAGEIFAELIGASSNAVEIIAPTEAELEQEGMEYLIAIRGDPVSKTSLLSTTIQSAMLLRRVLDPNGATSGHAGLPSMYGRRLFVFTDDLDVTNRLYHNLLDAEGLNSKGQPKPNRTPLAAFRSRVQRDNATRAATGQSWQLCEEIGQPEGLSVPLRVGRTSSQDSGVDSGSDVIIATASLEVGYNDPYVGAVLQHKAPHGPAGFLQRKGRAGRQRTMRPWTVIVLSDYGRDRLAYQAYEALFDPVLRPRALPVANRYVLRIQAVYAFMDWLAAQLPTAAPKGSIYTDLSGPTNRAYIAARQQLESGILRRLLHEGDPLQSSLANHLSAALKLSLDEIAPLLWDPPRSLMLHVVPTILRRLESEWTRVKLHPAETDRDLQVPGQPLPDFVPPSLFSDLNLPEVLVETPAPGARQDSLPILQAIRTLAPGKVTRRFAVGSAYTSHWIAPNAWQFGSPATQELEVESICAEYEEIGRFQTLLENGEPATVRCIRPWTMRPSLVPKSVVTTSNSFLNWRTQLLPVGAPLALEAPQQTGWDTIVSAIEFYGHVYGSQVEARRFAISARASVRTRGNPVVETVIRYIGQATRERASVGFVSAVDGLRITVSLCPDRVIGVDGMTDSDMRAFRSAYFRHRVLTDTELGQHANSFQRDWIAQVYLSALTAWAIKEETTLEYAAGALHPLLPTAAQKVLRVIFEAPAGESEDDDGESVEEPAKLLQDMLELFSLPAVADRLRELARTLWSSPDDGWRSWARQRYLATLGNAVLEACVQTYPEASVDDLLLDIDSGGQANSAPSSAEHEVWITESTIGGAGVLEEVVRRYADDPRRFFRLVESALGPSDYELVDAELTRVLRLASDDAELRTLLHTVRHSTGHEELHRASAALKQGLAARGILVTHPIMSAIYARILRPGSRSATDDLLLSLIEEWRSEEVRLGVELDARVFAYLASERDDLGDALEIPGLTAPDARVVRFHALYGLLWPRGNAIRPIGLSSYNPFAELPPADRSLVLNRIEDHSHFVDISDPEWRDVATAKLKVSGTVRLTAAPDSIILLKEATLSIMAEPLEIDVLHVYPQLVGVERGPAEFRATLYVAEAVQ